MRLGVLPLDHWLAKTLHPFSLHPPSRQLERIPNNNTLLFSNAGKFVLALAASSTIKTHSLQACPHF